MASAARQDRGRGRGEPLTRQGWFLARSTWRPLGGDCDASSSYETSPVCTKCSKAWKMLLSMISQSTLVWAGVGAVCNVGGERPWPRRSSVVAWRPREESDED